MKRIAIAGAFFIILISLALATKVPEIQKWLRSAEIYKSGLIEVEARSIASLGTMDAFETAAKSGGFDNATSALRTFTDDLAEIPGITNEQAAAIETILATLPNYTTEANAAFIKLIKETSGTGGTALANAIRIKAAFDQGKHR
jgi:hypothetical protein